MRKIPDDDTIFTEDDPGPEAEEADESTEEETAVVAFHRAWKELAPALHRIPKVDGRRVEGVNVKSLLFMLLSPDPEESAHAATQLNTGLRHALELVTKKPSCEDGCEAAEAPSLRIPAFLEVLDSWLEGDSTMSEGMSSGQKKRVNRPKRRRPTRVLLKQPDGSVKATLIGYFRDDIEDALRLLKRCDPETVEKKLNISKTVVGEIIRGKLKPDDRPYRKEAQASAAE